MQFPMYLFFTVTLAILAACYPVEAGHLSTKHSHARRSMTGKSVPRDLGGLLDPVLGEC